VVFLGDLMLPDYPTIIKKAHNEIGIRGCLLKWAFWFPWQGQQSTWFYG